MCVLIMLILLETKSQLSKKRLSDGTSVADMVKHLNAKFSYLWILIVLLQLFTLKYCLEGHSRSLKPLKIIHNFGLE